jgi:hypothetical protein
MGSKNFPAARAAKRVQLRDDLTDEEVKFVNSRAANRVKVSNTNELFLKKLQALLEASPIPAPTPYKGPVKKYTERILNVMLSDLHYGSDLLASESGSNYGITEETRRTAAVVATVADWKRQYRSETVLNVHLLGDIIEGKLHDRESAAPLTEQFHRALLILTQGLRFLASEFHTVVVRAVPGNHGRRKDRHEGRAVNQKWDSIENMLYGALKVALANVPNLKFEIPLTPYYRYQAFNRYGWMTHGDTCLNVGNPGKSISVESVRRQINEINASEKEHSDLFGAGHVHVASSTRLPSGPVLVTNGCLIPSGEYGQSIGIWQTVCSQQIWESVPDIIYGHRMEILVGKNEDQNSSLDKIIKPFKGMEDFGK